MAWGIPRLLAGLPLWFYLAPTLAADSRARVVEVRPGADVLVEDVQPEGAALAEAAVALNAADPALEPSKASEGASQRKPKPKHTHGAASGSSGSNNQVKTKPRPEHEEQLAAAASASAQHKAILRREATVLQHRPEHGDVTVDAQPDGTTEAVFDANADSDGAFGSDSASVVEATDEDDPKVEDALPKNDGPNGGIDSKQTPSFTISQKRTKDGMVGYDWYDREPFVSVQDEVYDGAPGIIDAYTLQSASDRGRELHEDVEARQHVLDQLYNAFIVENKTMEKVREEKEESKAEEEDDLESEIDEVKTKATDKMEEAGSIMKKAIAHKRYKKKLVLWLTVGFSFLLIISCGSFWAWRWMKGGPRGKGDASKTPGDGAAQAAAAEDSGSDVGSDVAD